MAQHEPGERVRRPGGPPDIVRLDPGRLQQLRDGQVAEGQRDGGGQPGQCARGPVREDGAEQRGHREHRRAAQPGG